MWSGETEADEGLELSQQLLEGSLATEAALENQEYLNTISTRLQAAVEKLLLAISETSNQVQPARRYTDRAARSITVLAQISLWPWQALVHLNSVISDVKEGPTLLSTMFRERYDYKVLVCPAGHSDKTGISSRADISEISVLTHKEIGVF